MKDIVKLLEKTLVGGYNDITVYNLKIALFRGRQCFYYIAKKAGFQPGFFDL